MNTITNQSPSTSTKEPTLHEQQAGIVFDEIVTAKIRGERGRSLEQLFDAICNAGLASSDDDKSQVVSWALHRVRRLFDLENVIVYDRKEKLYRFADDALDAKQYRSRRLIDSAHLLRNVAQDLEVELRAYPVGDGTREAENVESIQAQLRALVLQVNSLARA